MHCMEYGKIIAVTGLPGLFELMSSKNDGAIVRSLEDKSTKFVSSRIHSFSHLESIEVYTVRDNVNLVDVFAAMDFERVYPSDLKKMVTLFSVLKNNDVDIKFRDDHAVEEEHTAVDE